MGEFTRRDLLKLAVGCAVIAAFSIGGDKVLNDREEAEEPP